MPERCSAFVATGSYTRDGAIVIAHNNWTTYLDGARWTIVFDIAPPSGHRILMDGLPGFIASDDDFGINAAGRRSPSPRRSRTPSRRRTAKASSIAI